jgi:hypothetical protein
MLQQVVGLGDIHGFDTDGIHVAICTDPRRYDHNLECSGHHCCSLDMPATGEELELHLTGDLR